MMLAGVVTTFKLDSEKEALQVSLNGFGRFDPGHCWLANSDLIESSSPENLNRDFIMSLLGQPAGIRSASPESAPAKLGPGGSAPIGANFFPHKFY